MTPTFTPEFERLGRLIEAASFVGKVMGEAWDTAYPADPQQAGPAGLPSFHWSGPMSVTLRVSENGLDMEITGRFGHEKLWPLVGLCAVRGIPYQLGVDVPAWSAESRGIAAFSAFCRLLGMPNNLSEDVRTATETGFFATWAVDGAMTEKVIVGLLVAKQKPGATLPDMHDANLFYALTGICEVLEIEIEDDAEEDEASVEGETIKGAEGGKLH